MLPHKSSVSGVVLAARVLHCGSRVAFICNNNITPSELCFALHEGVVSMCICAFESWMLGTGDAASPGCPTFDAAQTSETLKINTTISSAIMGIVIFRIYIYSRRLEIPNRLDPSR